MIVLQGLPCSMGQLTMLKVLNLDNNCIKLLPDEVSSLITLKGLSNYLATYEVTTFCCLATFNITHFVAIHYFSLLSVISISSLANKLKRALQKTIKVVIK